MQLEDSALYIVRLGDRIHPLARGVDMDQARISRTWQALVSKILKLKSPKTS